MGCSCGGKKAKPSSGGPGVPAPAPGSSAAASVGVRQQFQLTTPDGRARTYGSRLEADAARVRSGGGTVTRF